MNGDNNSKASKRRFDQDSSRMHTRITAERKPKSKDEPDVDDLPDDPEILKTRIKELENEIQRLIVLSDRTSNASQSPTGSESDVEDLISDTLDDFTTEFSERLDSISSLEDQQKNEGFLERYNVAAILLQVQFIASSFFIMLNFINAATAGGIALLLSTFLQFGHTIYTESETESRRKRAKRDRL
jgi:hypothetical protein